MTPRATPNAILLLLLLLCTVAWSGVVGVPLTDSASEALEDEDEAFADTSNNISQNNDANNDLSLDAARFAGHHDNVLHPMDISAWQEHFRNSPPDHQLDPRLPASPHPAPHVAPRYMLELYDKFEKERYAHPVSNIVRSFQSTESGTERVDSRHRVHTLVFNLSSVSEDEDISLAELRLHSTGVANSILVTISQVVTYTWDDGSTETEARRLADTAIHGQYRRWEAVPLTDHVRKWIRSDNTELHVVSVRVSSGMPWQELADDGVDISPADTDLAPLLVVFSNDRSRRQSAERDLREMLHHEMDLMDPDLLDEDYDEEYDDDEGEGDDVTGGGVGYGDGEGIRGGDGRRDAGRNGGGYGMGNAGGNAGGYGMGNAGGNGNGYSMGNAVGNSVEDNEWNADGGDDDKGKVVDDGGDYEDEVSETAYGNIETGTGGTGYSQQKSTDLSDNPGEESTNQAKQKLSRRSVAKDKLPGSDVTGRQSEHHVTRRSTRSAPRPPRKSRRRRISCRRKALYVRFSDLNWHNWIIAPEGYMAYECTGRCYYPLSDHLTPTNHAIIQTLLHTTHRKRASRACCVPTRLDPISILYIDEKGVVTYKYKYKDMVVAECGCR